MRREIVVTPSAKELSMGITKLSGFNLCRKVKMAIIYAMIAMIETAKMLVAKS